MSVVIVGGNERMVREYKDLCKEYNYKAKVFIQYNEALRKSIGTPDLMVLFTNTVSHKMINIALSRVKNSDTAVARSHSSSITALRAIMEEYA